MDIHTSAAPGHTTARIHDGLGLKANQRDMPREAETKSYAEQPPRMRVWVATVSPPSTGQPQPWSAEHTQYIHVGPSLAAVSMQRSPGSWSGWDGVGSLVAITEYARHVVIESRIRTGMIPNMTRPSAALDLFEQLAECPFGG